MKNLVNMSLQKEDKAIDQELEKNLVENK